ncbi:hypothetical protein O1611_g3150 [Lasiodiplodia mahajangana]|uniref:Uncharacterized protein n=1 Tax=Lasiodiplodia mahajangana TaxID=1108764 RepID=A0ACC2JST0_9PEZI|nr:hypothetical protein O1611_g3150 [Lasiodiplodia mahajangana]
MFIGVMVRNRDFPSPRAANNEDLRPKLAYDSDQGWALALDPPEQDLLNRRRHEDCWERIIIVEPVSSSLDEAAAEVISGSTELEKINDTDIRDGPR